MCGILGAMAIKSKPKWEIPSRARTCSKGLESLSPDSSYYSLLIQDAEGAYERRDYCLTCWQNELSSGNIPTKSTHWKALVPPRNIKPTSKDRAERALDLLRETLISDYPNSQAEAFLLGLFLQRMRIAAARQEIQREGVECILYEVLETGEVITVPKVSLSDFNVADLEKKLNEIL